jgi:hypothetical protein
MASKFSTSLNHSEMKKTLMPVFIYMKNGFGITLKKDGETMQERREEKVHNGENYARNKKCKCTYRNVRTLFSVNSVDRVC